MQTQGEQGRRRVQEAAWEAGEAPGPRWSGAQEEELGRAGRWARRRRSSAGRVSEVWYSKFASWAATQDVGGTDFFCFCLGLVF
jgi:hypothetical protein